MQHVPQVLPQEATQTDKKFNYKEYYLQNKDEINARARLRYRTNIDKHREWRRENYKKNIEKKRESARLRYNTNRVACQISNKNWKINNPDKARSSQLKTMYGIDLETYNLMLVEQNNSCAICGCLFNDVCVPHVDHCHSTHKVRKLLCKNCNLMLGNCKDKQSTLLKAVEYLEEYACN